MLPTPDEIRNRHDREFQAKVLAAVEKPKQARVFKVINAPFFPVALDGCTRDAGWCLPIKSPAMYARCSANH